MQWSELYDAEHAPLNHQIREFVNTPLWDDLADHLEQTCHVRPKLYYSGCSMQKGFWKGWNVKYYSGLRDVKRLIAIRGGGAALACKPCP